jgi:hypothetical protein
VPGAPPARQLELLPGQDERLLPAAQQSSVGALCSRQLDVGGQAASVDATTLDRASASTAGGRTLVRAHDPPQCPGGPGPWSILPATGCWRLFERGRGNLAPPPVSAAFDMKPVDWAEFARYLVELLAVGARVRSRHARRGRRRLDWSVTTPNEVVCAPNWCKRSGALEKSCAVWCCRHGARERRQPVRPGLGGSRWSPRLDRELEVAMTRSGARRLRVRPAEGALVIVLALLWLAPAALAR